jgi:hypothetical protein
MSQRDLSQIATKIIAKIIKIKKLYKFKKKNVFKIISITIQLSNAFLSRSLHVNLTNSSQRINKST